MESLERIAKGLAIYLGQEVEAKELHCDGCLSPTVAIQCRVCHLRACALGKGLAHCAGCTDFPCRQLTDFNNDEMEHHSEVLDNIRRQQDTGIDAWLEEQEGRWRCTGCGSATSWYDESCLNCEADIKAK